jgi:hypothetical protein
MRVKWAVELDGQVHLIELDHGDYSGRKTIKQVRALRLRYRNCVRKG